MAMMGSVESMELRAAEQARRAARKNISVPSAATTCATMPLTATSPCVSSS